MFGHILLDITDILVNQCLVGDSEVTSSNVLETRIKINAFSIEYLTCTSVRVLL